MDVLWNETPRRRWEGLTADAAWQQHWGYGAACARLGSRVLRAEVRDADGPLALAQFTHRAFFGRLHGAVCTRGPVWLRDAGPEARASAYRALKRTIPLPWPRGVFLTPEAGEDPALRGAGLRRVMSAYATAMLDLTRGEGALRAAMDQKWRNRLGAAERAGLDVTVGKAKPGSYGWLLAEEAAQQRAKRYRALPLALLPAWQAEAGHLRLAVARTGGQPVAAMLFVIHGTGALYQVGWASEAGRRASAHNLLLWRAVRDLAARGVRRLDLGGLNTEEGAGIARFKLGSGAELARLCGTWY